jgi:hypothetical protein
MKASMMRLAALKRRARQASTLSLDNSSQLGGVHPLAILTFAALGGVLGRNREAHVRGQFAVVHGKPEI